MPITIYFKSENIQIPNLPSSLEDLKSHIQNTLQNKLPKTWDIYSLNDQGHNVPISDDIEYAKTLEREQISSDLNIFVLPIKIEHHEEHKVAYEKRDIACTDEEYQAKRDQGQVENLGNSMSMQSSISSVSSFSSISVSQNLKEEEKFQVRYSQNIQEGVPRDPKVANLRGYLVETRGGLKELKRRYKEIISLARNGKREALHKCDELFSGLPEGTLEVLKASLTVPFKDFQEDLKKQIGEVLPAENEAEMSFIAQGKKKIIDWAKLKQIKRDFKLKAREVKRDFREMKREEKQKDRHLKKLERRESLNMKKSESFQQKISQSSGTFMSSMSMKVKFSS